jgi:hypothetical protein
MGLPRTDEESRCLTSRSRRSMCGNLSVSIGARNDQVQQSAKITCATPLLALLQHPGKSRANPLRAASSLETIGVVGGITGQTRKELFAGRALPSSLNND